jgi:hypothetical protein
MELWCDRNGQSLNVSKCNVMTLSLKHTKRFYEDKIGDSVLQRLSTLNDLGITFDQKLAFTESRYDSYDPRISSSFKALGFVIR